VVRANVTDAKPPKTRTESGSGPDGPTRSTTIALTSDETRLVVVNREANSLSIILVKDADGNDVAVKLTEIAVGQERRGPPVRSGGVRHQRDQRDGLGR
jgi:DNA-binding beta-propeller fold protein YncE